MQEFLEVYMSDTKSFILEYSLIRERDFSVRKDLPLGAGFRNVLRNLSTPEEAITSVQQAAGVPPGSTSKPSISNTPVPGVPQVGSKSTDPKPNLIMGLNVDKTVDVNVPKIQQAASKLLDQLYTQAPGTAREAGREFTSGSLSSLGKTFSDPKTLAKIGAGALATGALVGGGMALGNRLFGRRPEKKKKKGQLLASSYNPYFRSAADIGGATGATAGTLGGLLGGRYAGAKAADALKLGQDSFGRTALQIGGQALGTVLGGTVGGIFGYEALKKRKKKREQNPMLPDMYRNA